ncbi:unnamed protein product [Microthlaspi erraticum]|uniref:Uncharacterized protein n=1 Tax=Microthlaspi erraticum TaxID=1685480 RepID=A0A6D2KC08_9BRAS|nr:unnamed protein product [Microthlaspi erraticum]
MDDGEERPAVGARPKPAKEPNPLNQTRQDREAQVQAEAEPAELFQAQQDQAQQLLPASKILPFGDGSLFLGDWTPSGLISDPISQKEVVFAHLLQISYNKDKTVAQRRDLSYLDLAHHIKSQTKKKNFSFRNLNIPINYIREVGLYKDEKITGPGVKTKGNFDHRQEASKKFVYETLETTPLGIVIDNSPEFECIEMGIHHVPAIPRNTNTGSLGVGSHQVEWIS